MGGGKEPRVPLARGEGWPNNIVSTSMNMLDPKGSSLEGKGEDGPNHLRLVPMENEARFVEVLSYLSTHVTFGDYIGEIFIT